MALQTSGAISLNEIHVEAGGSSGSSATINDTDIRALISKNSGAVMAFGEWYGASSFGPPTTMTGSLWGSRAFWTGGYSATSPTGRYNYIQYNSIASPSSTCGDFGNIYTPAQGGSALTNGARIVNASSAGSNYGNKIEYWAAATLGNGTDFGDLSLSRGFCATANKTNGLGIFFGGSQGLSNKNTIDYIWTQTTGNATDFGDATSNRDQRGGCSSTAGRAVVGGGGYYTNRIDYKDMATTGNASYFGTLSGGNREGVSAMHNGSRAIFGGGKSNNTTYHNNMTYVTMASTGNSSNFGNLIQTASMRSGTSNGSRGVSGGGFRFSGGAYSYNTIDYVTIASTSNASDHSDLFQTVHGMGCSSGA